MRHSPSEEESVFFYNDRARGSFCFIGARSDFEVSVVSSTLLAILGAADEINSNRFPVCYSIAVFTLWTLKQQNISSVFM